MTMRSPPGDDCGAICRAGSLSAAPTIPSMSGVRVDIVILTFDPAPGMLEAAVCSLLDHSGPGQEPDVHLRVVDNGGAADALLADARWGGQPLSELVNVSSTANNLGFSGGMNVGIDAALRSGADVVVLLNDDTVVTHGWLEPLLAEFGDPGVGVARTAVDLRDRRVDQQRRCAHRPRRRRRRPASGGTG